MDIWNCRPRSNQIGPYGYPYEPDTHAADGESAPNAPETPPPVQPTPTERQMRAEAATKLLEAIGHSGRQFFYHLTRTARMEVDSRGRVWFIDHYTSKRVYTHYRGQWRGFTSGGTMRSLVEALREFIRKGTPVPSHHFGPWPDWYCDGDLWGYGRLEMEKVRQRARDLGLVPHDA